MKMPLHTSDVFVASLAAEFTQRTLLHPIDTLKARLQYGQFSSAVTGPPRLPFAGELAAMKAAVSAGTGLPSLFRGLAPALIGVVPNALVYMPTYELSKTALAGTPFAPLAGCITGCACAVVRVPISVVKSRVQLQIYDSPLEALLASTSGPNGVRGLYAGWGATLVLDVSYATIQFTLLEQARVAADYIVGGRVLTAAEDGIVGFFVGLCTGTLTAPLDLVRTRLMAQTTRISEGATRSCAGGLAASAAYGRSFGYRGVVHGLRSASADGFFALWRGVLPRLFLKSVGSSVWYAVYMTGRKRLAERRRLEAGGRGMTPD